MKYKIFGVAGLAGILVVGASCKTNQPPVSVTNESSKPTITKSDTTTSSARPPVWVAKQGPYNPAKTRVSDLIHTQLKVRFDWEKQQMPGEAILTLKPYFYPQNTVVLDARGFDIRSVQLITGTRRKDLKYTYDN